MQEEETGQRSMLHRGGLSEGKEIFEKILEWSKWAKQRCVGRLQGKRNSKWKGNEIKIK